METAAEGDGGGTFVARLFVGGLAEGVSAADLEGVLGSIGRVAGVEFVRTSGRCFAYVDFHCPSDKALAKLFSTYNGCKWKGGKLKLEKAKEHYLVRLKREWEQEAAAAAAAQEVPAEENVEKQEDKEKRKLEKDDLESSKVNIYFPKLRKLRPLPFKGSGKHKYSFRNIEVPSYPIHFCDCEEHCGPPEKANEEYATALNRVAYEKERSIMNSVMSKFLEKDNEQIDTEEMQKHDNAVNIMEPSDAETEASDSDTEPSDSENDLRIEETEETPEDLDELQMEEAEDSSEDELDDDLVINTVPRKANKSAVQSNRANQVVHKVEQSRKRQQFEDAPPPNKRRKSEDLSESRNKKQPTSVISDGKSAVKSLPAISGAIQNEQKAPGLSGKGTDGFSSVLDRAQSSASLQGVDALTGSSTKNGGSQSVISTEPKKGSLWTQKSAWRDLGKIGGDLPGVHYIRDVSDADSLVSSLGNAKKIVVIGGGYIGMEVAAAACGWNLDTTIIFPEDHIMPRLFTPSLAKKYEELYEQNGVKFVKGALIDKLDAGSDGRVSSAVLKDGSVVEADTVIVGIGAKPAVSPFEAVGVNNEVGGIEVDSMFRTSIPGIFAIGDVAAFPLKMYNRIARVEHVDHARKSAHHCVETLLTSQAKAYDYLPYFYSRVFEYDGSSRKIWWQFYGDNVGETVEVGNFDPKIVTFWIDSDSRLKGVFLESGTSEEFSLLPKLARSQPLADKAKLKSATSVEDALEIASSSL